MSSFYFPSVNYSSWVQQSRCQWQSCVHSGQSSPWERALTLPLTNPAFSLERHFPQTPHENITPQQHSRDLLFWAATGGCSKFQVKIEIFTWNFHLKFLGTAGRNCSSFSDFNSMRTEYIFRQPGTQPLPGSWCNTIFFSRQRYKLSKQIWDLQSSNVKRLSYLFAEIVFYILLYNATLYQN